MLVIMFLFQAKIILLSEADLGNCYEIEKRLW